MTTNTPDDSGSAENANVDVALNIFGKPWQTALSILSLLKQSASHINALWLQFEPMGSAYDKLSPYLIADYIKQTNLIKCHVFQPETWLARGALTRDELQDPKIRQGIRYQHAFENSKMPYLFLTHNDVYILKDIIGDLKKEIGSAFSIGQLGQCWNCPAHNESLCQHTLGRSACTPQTYFQFRPTAEELTALYANGRKKEIFARPYLSGNCIDDFRNQPWPLPECRINEWTSLINLTMTKKFCAPFGSDYPPGAYAPCCEDRLDISVPFFRDMHARQMFAKHFDISKHVRHWVGTGNKSPARYAFSEDRARNIIEKNYPDFAAWVKRTQH